MRDVSFSRSSESTGLSGIGAGPVYDISSSRPGEITGFSASAVIAIAALASGCAGNQTVGPVVSEVVSRSAVSANDLVITALGQIGAAYRYGGATPAGFDCSGLVHYVHARHGIAVPRTSTEQFSNARPVARRYARAGDLVFFRIRGRISHVGIYLGDGEFVHAPATGKPVQVEQLDKQWYRKRLAGFGRLTY